MAAYIDIFALFEKSKLARECDFSNHVKGEVLKPRSQIDRLSLRCEFVEATHEEVDTRVDGFFRL